MRTILVTGGAGYVGSLLVPQLLEHDYRVKVIDLYIYGEHVLDSVKDHPGLQQIKGDIRDEALLRKTLQGCDAVIHLACISNDPSFELDPALSRSINFEAFAPLVNIAKAVGVQRFIYASTSSVYGITDVENVTEELPLVPLTDYNKYKGLCEPILLAQQNHDFTTVVVRPATVCGYSPRMRLDLTVNVLTISAVTKRHITVFGGWQKRPNIHIKDVVDLYQKMLEYPKERIAGQIYNAGYQNHTISEIAGIVRDVVRQEIPGPGEVSIETVSSVDQRSYHISSGKIKQSLGFEPKRTIQDAVVELCTAFSTGLIPNALSDSRYYNVKMMQTLGVR